MYIDLPSKFWSPRTKPIRFIVLHTTEGTDSRTWLTETGNVSAHYLVRGETVYRLVSEDRVAWHAGIVVGDPTTELYDPDVNPNEESIGIEVEGYAADRLPDNAIRATGALIRDIWTRHKVPLVAHAHLSPGSRSDPGTENYARIVAATQEEDMDTAELEQRIDAKIAEYGSRLQPELEVDRKRIDSLESRVNSIDIAGEHDHEIPVTRTGGPVKR